MKKLVALFLAAALMCACVPAAMAAEKTLTADDIFGTFDWSNQGHWDPACDHSDPKELVEFELLHDVDKLVACVYDADGVPFEFLGDSNGAFKAGEVYVSWTGTDNGWHPGSGTYDFYLVIDAYVDGQVVSVCVPFSYYYNHTIYHYEDIRWFPHNTICVAGVEFRYAKPELTNKWYNFAVLDLSQDGTQTYDLVASNMYVIGKVTVNVSGDEVTVDWKLRKQGANDANFMLEDEFMTIFSSLDAVTEVEPENFEGPTYAFGQPISIANDLGGDTTVLLYIRNVATYCNNVTYKYLQPFYHARYAHGENSRLITRNAMMAMLDADAIR